MYLVGYLNEVAMTHSSFEEEFEEIQQKQISVTKFKDEKSFEIVAVKKPKKTNKPISKETKVTIK